jgi:hypothetical protein
MDMKEQRFPLVYAFLALVCILLCMSEELSLYLPKEPHRRLIARQNTCSSKSCPNLFFLSGIYDLVNFNIRFTDPFEDHEPTTLFAKASFSEFAVSRVKKFTSFEFSLSSKLDPAKNSISGAYSSQHLVNGSAIVVVSELPGQEVWFHSDSTISAPCLNRTTSLIVFANALNSNLNLFTRTPDGDCQQIEREGDEETSPLSYCQAGRGFVWEIFTDWRCSTQRIASEYIGAGLGTVYSVIIGDNVSRAELVTLSSHSSFEGVRTFEEHTKSHPSFFERNMLILVLSVGLGSFSILLLFCLGSKSRKPSLAGFREGDIVVYQLTPYQSNILTHKDSQILNPKTKGFALVVKSPPVGLFDRIVSRWRQPRPSSPLKSVLLLQPLKKIVRSESQSFDERERSGAKNDMPPLSSDLELTVDEVEAPLSINQWGFRGGRVLVVVSPIKILRRYIFLGQPPPPQKKTSVRFSDKPSDEARSDTETLIWLAEETDCLLPPASASDSPLRKRKAMAQHSSPSSEIEEKDEDEPTTLAKLWRGWGCMESKGKSAVELGAGWAFSTGEDGFVIADDPSSPDQSRRPFLQNSSSRYQKAIGSEEVSGVTETLAAGVGYSYLLKDFPSAEIPQIYCREWVYPFAEDGQASKKKDLPVHPPTDRAKEPPRILRADSKKAKASEDLLVEKEEAPSKDGDSGLLQPPDVSRFVASPQPVSVRIAMRRELSRKNKIGSPAIEGANSPAPVFTAPRLLSSPLPAIGDRDGLPVEEISSPMRSYFVTPPRVDSFKTRKPIRQLSADLYSQTNRKSKKEPTLISPNSSPLLNSGAAVPPSQISVNADREVNTGLGSLDKVMTGSKLELDELDNDDDEHLAGKTASRKQSMSPSRHSSQSKLSARTSAVSPKPSLPPVVISPRLPSALNTTPSPPFLASPKTLPLKISPRKTLSARNIAKGQESIREDGKLEEKPRGLPARASSRFDMDLSFLSDVED